MDKSFPKPSKKKQFGKVKSLTSVETLKTPKIRRKSLGSGLPTTPPNLTKKSLDLDRRKSIASGQISKKFKKQQVSSSLDNNIALNGVTASHNQGKEKQIKNSLENVPSPIIKKAGKRPLSVNEPLTTLQSKKKNIKLNPSTPLVLAPPKEGLPNTHTRASKSIKKNIKLHPSTPLVLAPPKEGLPNTHTEASKSLKKNSKRTQKLADESSLTNKASIEDLEKKFSINSGDVENALNGVIKFASNNPHLQNQLFNEEVPLFLQINSFKVPKTKGPVKQLFRVPMPHSILPSEPDICLIVPDVKGVKNDEHEKHLEHYESLLQSKDVTGIKKIMTFHEFRTEYETFELKNRLVDLYDAFLVDGKISGKVVHKCGSIFYKKRKVPIAVKLYLPKLKLHIEKALKKGYFHLNVRSDSHTVQIGHSKNSTEDLIGNVYSVIEFLDKQFPGKMENIRNLNVYAHRGSSIPIYVSLKNPNEIKVPTLSSKKPKAYKSFTGELTTQYNADVVVRPSGHVVVRRKRTHAKQEEENADEDITDAEILRENKRVDEVEQQTGDGSSKSKKRKISESTKDQLKKNPVQSVQGGQKKVKKVKELTNTTEKRKGIAQYSAEETKVGKGKKNNNKNRKENPHLMKRSNTDKNIQKTFKKTKVIATKGKNNEKDEKGEKQKTFKNKNKKKFY